jgi:peptidoglycan-N-acetylglucosamine deacetylase
MTVWKMKERCRQTRTLVLTFDDGPSSELTPRLLDLLARYEARASFFPLGREVENRKVIIDQLAAEGHELGSHTYAHLDPWRTWPWRTIADIREGYRALSPWVPANGLFRPPFGKLTPASWVALRLRGAPICFWTIDSWDTLEPPAAPQATVRQVIADGGGVVLLHDFNRAAERNNQAVLDLTAALLECARKEQLTVKRLGDLIREATGEGRGG